MFFSQEYWLRQNTPTTKRLTNCFFIDTNTGWVSGDSGVIMKSTDSGRNWNIQNSNTFHDIISIHFVNERLGWANARNEERDVGRNEEKDFNN